jgi:hypothetical protein
MRARHLYPGLLVVLVLLLSNVPAFGTPSRPGSESLAGGPSVQWRFGPSSPFGGTRFDGQYVAQTGRIYFLGFRTFADATDGSVWYFDVASRMYVDTGVDMPLPISNYQIAALNDANGLGLYIFGGRNATGQIVRAVQVYYPATNTAQGVPSDPWPGQTPAGCVSLPAMGVTVMQNRAVVIGGLSFAANGCIDDQSAQTWVFNPMAPAGSRWSAGPNLNVPRGYITPAAVGGRIYAIGGDTISAGLLIPMQTVEAWQPGAGGWNDAAVADLPVPCDESQAFDVSAGPFAPGIVLAGCGQWPNAQPFTAFYDGTANAWSRAGMLNDNRRNHAGAAVPMGGTSLMYILGGYGEDSSFIEPIQTSELGRMTARSVAPSGFEGGGNGSTSGNPATS